MTTDQLAAAAPTAPKAAAPWRSLEEVKQELMRRAGRLSPFEDIRREDAQQVVDALTSLDRDLWAQLWSQARPRLRGQGRRAGARRRRRTRARRALHARRSIIAASAAIRCRARPARRSPTGIRCGRSARRRSISTRRSRSSSCRSRARRWSAICNSRPAWRSRRWSCIGAASTAGRRTACARPPSSCGTGSPR